MAGFCFQSYLKTSEFKQFVFSLNLQEIEFSKFQDHPKIQEMQSAGMQGSKMQMRKLGGSGPSGAGVGGSGQAPGDQGEAARGAQHTHPKKFTYGAVLGRPVGKGWLETRPENPMPVHEYRRTLLAALGDARDRYVQRQRQQGGLVPAAIEKQVADDRPLKTVDPGIPDFAAKRNALHKFAGMCIKSKFKRFFTVDQESLKYYEDEKGRTAKKTLELKDAKAFVQEKSDFMEKQKSGDNEKGDEWAEPDNKYRVGIELKGRAMKAVYFYSTGLHDAKFLLVNIQLYANEQQAATTASLIELAYRIEKVARFQKIVSLMCFAKEKRFVAMHGFQQLALDMIEIAQQSQEYRRQLTLKWFTNMLGEDEKPTIRSPFRTANPRPLQSLSEVRETRINKHISQLQTFTKNRKINRQPAVAQEINKQMLEETTGIPVQYLALDEFNPGRQGLENVWSISNGQASLIFDSEESHKFMIIENKSLDPPMPAATSLINSMSRKRQAQNLIRKINIGDISFISTDLDQTTQFDFNNKINKQASYRIKLYGRINALGQSRIDDANIAPSQLGLDVLRQSKAKYRISVNQIKFPPHLAQQENEKITLFVKLYQFQDSASGHSRTFESTSQCIKIKGYNGGSVYPQKSAHGASGPAAVFNVDKVGSGGRERFAVGLVVRTNEKPIPLVTERLMDHEELKGHEQRQFFSFDDLDAEQHARLQDAHGDQFEIRFSVSSIDPATEGLEISERSGKRLLVGRYVLYQGKPAYVRSLDGNETIDIVETISKRERKVHVQNVSLLETHGVNVFKLDAEPSIVRASRYDWTIVLKVQDKRILNSIQSKIQIRQAYLALRDQDTKTRDPLSTIEGDMVVSLIETKGLIVPSEVNRRQQDLNNRIDPVVEVRLERLSGAILKRHTGEALQNRREVVWGQQGKASSGGIGEFVVSLGRVNHSGELLPEKEVRVERSKRSTTVKKPAKAAAANAALPEQAEKHCLHFLVRNGTDGPEIGDAKIELDELIDINLADLAKEYCVCLNRSHVLAQRQAELEKAEAEANKKGAKTKESIQQEMSMYTQYSGIIRFQTLFQPTKDTSLRFEQVRDTRRFTSPKQLLHFEYLLAKSDFDQFKYKIPQIAYNPNIKNLGEKHLDLPHLIAQCEGNPEIQGLLKRIQSQDGPKNSRQQATATDDLIQEIDQTLKFQSPFEKLYIILKLQRKERPFLEQVFFSFKNIWDIYSQLVKNQAFDSLNLNEWLGFIDELTSKHNFDQMEAVVEAADGDDDHDDGNSDAPHTQRSVSFVGDMVKQMNKKAAGLRRQSTMLARDIESGAVTDSKNFSLVLCQEWEKEGNQSFIDLVNLVNSGIPAMLRTVVWGDLMKCNLIAIEEKKQMMKNYSKKYNKQLSTFENFLEISQKYDSIAFRQIDQDISDFKFPAYYYEDSLDQNSSQMGYKVASGTSSRPKNVNRINKLKHDKQQMRKLLRVLLVWGKNFKSKGVNYQLCYPTGFLKVVHRFINLMSMEDAFWILIGFIRQYPRLWCLQESAMLDDAKSNFRFELTAFKAILEVNFPKISQKLYQVGFSVEVLVYDSMTSLYSDYFHSDTLLRIWDQMIFYFNTSDQSSKRRAIWLLLAPALLIISQKQQVIEQAQTAKEIIDAYKDGCGTDYNPNHIIEMLNDVIDDMFVTEGKQKTKSSMSMVGSGGTGAITESGGTGSGGKEAKSTVATSAAEQKPAGFLAGFFPGGFGATPPKKQLDANPVKADEARRSYQQKQNLIFEESRHLNQVVSDFLFKNSEEVLNQAKNSKDASKPPVGGSRANRPRRVSEDDSMDFGQNDHNSIDDGFGPASGGLKPASHQTLDYRHWRMDIIPAIQNQFLMTEEIVDDDLHEFEDTVIYQKADLDIKALHLYLHNLDSWYGTDDGRTDFRVQVQYGRLHSNGKFEVKLPKKGSDPGTVHTDANLQHFRNFKYTAGYNHIKVKVMTAETEEKVCHCYVDLRGHQRGKFIYFQKTMNAKEYTKSPESQVSLTQLKMSLFLQSTTDKAEDRVQQNTEDEETNKLTYLYSLKKYEPGRINIYRSTKEQYLQKVLLSSLQHVVHEDYVNFEHYLGQDTAIDILNYKYNFTEILPRTKFGHLNLSLFKNFVEKCMPEHANVISVAEFNQMYKDLLRSKSKQEEAKNAKGGLTPKGQESSQNFASQSAILDTERAKDQTAAQVMNMSKELLGSSKDAKIFSLRSFVFSVLFQSPITVKEKLDVLYDITDMSNRFQDGIDMHDAHMIYDMILRQHLYYMPSNELRAQVENVFNGGEISGIIGAYWTRKQADQIKYGMDKREETGFTQLEEFLVSSRPSENDGGPNVQQSASQHSVIDVTKEVQETFVMYQNLFGNKLLDFNDDTSPFKQFNNIFASTGKGDLGSILLEKTLSLGRALSKKYRLCLVSQIAGGERTLTEIKYNLTDGSIIVDEEKQPSNDKHKFKRFFMKNINVLDLSGKQRALGKHEFMAGTRKIPLVYDLLRAETFWQDRKLDQQPTIDKQSKAAGSSYQSKTSSSKIASLKMKNRFAPVVTVLLSDKDKIFIFKFESRVMGGRTTQPQMQEVVPRQIYLLEIDALYLEDIVLDMRDRIVTELTKVAERGMNLSDDFISEIEGKMEFYVRKVSISDRPPGPGLQQNQSGKAPEIDAIHDSVVGNTQGLTWLWKDVNDFDRMEKFSDDEVFEDEVVFKLVKKQAVDEEILDEKPQHILEGYDCFSIYKHSDNSYEWRLCKIVGKELQPQFKQLAMDAFLDVGAQKRAGEPGGTGREKFGANYGSSAHESDQYHYYLEFQHLKEYGREMWVKRRREDVIFSSRYARDQQSFEASCHKFIMDTYAPRPQAHY